MPKPICSEAFMWLLQLIPNIHIRMSKKLEYQLVLLHFADFDQCFFEVICNQSNERKESKNKREGKRKKIYGNRYAGVNLTVVQMDYEFKCACIKTDCFMDVIQHAQHELTFVGKIVPFAICHLNFFKIFDLQHLDACPCAYVCVCVLPFCLSFAVCLNL